MGRHSKSPNGDSSQIAHGAHDQLFVNCADNVERGDVSLMTSVCSSDGISEIKGPAAAETMPLASVSL